MNALDGYDELFRHVFACFAPFETLSQRRVRITSFDVANNDQKARLIAQQVERLIEARESIFIVDRGGLLDDRGAFQLPLYNVLRLVNPSRHPQVIIIAERMVPFGRREALGNTLFCRVNVLRRGDIGQLIGLLLQRENVRYSDEQVGKLIDLADDHPFNVAFMISFIKMYSIDLLLADPEQLNQFKYKRSSQFIRNCEFDELESRVLAILKDFTTLSFDLICDAAGGEQGNVARALQRLIELHIVEAAEDTYTLSAPLRIAIELDRRFRLQAGERRRILGALAGAFAQYNDDSHVQNSVIDTAILTA